ncbi:hypothetical protein GOODEAATRI_022795 [Goodea atripinnis]|uniref:Uncharacterized protein n=1 Tax=Goodea atripinnis TaxID=208336 RepID=A0ABV0P731_9TELE
MSGKIRLSDRRKSKARQRPPLKPAVSSCSGPGTGTLPPAVTMARTGFCDSKPLLDLHKKADEKRAPLRTWANACGSIDRCQPVEVEESRAAPVKMEPERRWVGLLSCYHLHPTAAAVIEPPNPFLKPNQLTAL